MIRFFTANSRGSCSGTSSVAIAPSMRFARWRELLVIEERPDWLQHCRTGGRSQDLRFRLRHVFEREHVVDGDEVQRAVAMVKQPSVPGGPS